MRFWTITLKCHQIWIKDSTLQVIEAWDWREILFRKKILGNSYVIFEVYWKWKMSSKLQMLRELGGKFGFNQNCKILWYLPIFHARFFSQHLFFYHAENTCMYIVLVAKWLILHIFFSFLNYYSSMSEKILTLKRSFAYRKAYVL